jgi:hypothetical protein
VTVERLARPGELCRCGCPAILVREREGVLVGWCGSHLDEEEPAS